MNQGVEKMNPRYFSGATNQTNFNDNAIHSQKSFSNNHFLDLPKLSGPRLKTRKLPKKPIVKEPFHKGN